MDFVEALILGLTQGLTEFIPVSSSGHEVILQTIFTGRSQHLFLQFVNTGTMLALLVFFRKKIWQILVDIFTRKNYKLARNLIITSVPAGLLGLLLADFIEKASFFGSVITVATAMILVGLVMIFLEKIPRLSDVKSGENLSPMRALLIGLAQTIALIPGVSRSGATIIAGRLNGLTDAKAAEYSFLAALPVMFGVALKTFSSSDDRAYLMENLNVILLSNVAAFVAGLFAVGFLLKYLEKKKSLKLFGWYRIVLATVVLILVSAGVINT